MSGNIYVEEVLRKVLKTLSPAAYTKHHSDSLLEHLYPRPTKKVKS